MKMDEHVEHDENVYDIPMEYENTSIHEYSTFTKLWNNKHAEICKSSRIRDRIMIAVIVMQIVCLAVAITSIIMHFNGRSEINDAPTIEKDYMSEIGEKYLVGTNGQICIKGPRVQKCLNGDKGSKGDKGQLGDKGEVGIKGPMGEKGPLGDKGEVGIQGPMGDKGPLGDKEKANTCGSRWAQFMGSWYYFQFMPKKSWHSAQTDCHRKGGFLVKIDNSMENVFLKNLTTVDKNPSHIWIGASDSEKESVFKWESDNTVLNYTDWNQQEPNNGQEINEEDCVDMECNAAYKWNDNICSRQFSYIFEIH
ncbi:collectin-12-like [Mytilus trossulus]|uniref:collectin-12-like n=1 Tax=Mytilus trossulus TaxID=6551 RepID=UPI00300553F9